MSYYYKKFTYSAASVKKLPKSEKLQRARGSVYDIIIDPRIYAVQVIIEFKLNVKISRVDKLQNKCARSIQEYINNINF